MELPSLSGDLGSRMIEDVDLYDGSVSFGGIRDYDGNLGVGAPALDGRASPEIA